MRRRAADGYMKDAITLAVALGVAVPFAWAVGLPGELWDILRRALSL